MDAEKEVFDLVHSCDDAIFSLSQHPNDVKSLYFGEGRGGLSVWDDRTGRVSSQWTLHEDRINTIDFNPQNPNIMATSSSDATVCLWDLRKVDAGKPKSLKIVNHERAVHSAYFSPSGSSLASTRYTALCTCICLIFQYAHLFILLDIMYTWLALSYRSVLLKI